MTTERIQFAVGHKGSKNVLAYLSDFRHARWPTLTHRTEITRAALRIAYAHDQRGRGVEWFIARGSKLSAPLSFVPVRDTAVPKVDVNLEQADLLRVDALERNEMPSRPAVLRACLHFLANIAAALGKEDRLVAGAAEGPHVAIDLNALISDQRVETRMFLPMRPDQPASEPPRREAPLDSERVDELFAIIWFTTSFNRWLTTHVDEVTHRAQKTLRLGATPPEKPDTELVPDREVFESWQTQLDLRRLFDEFWRAEEQAFECNEPNTLQHEFPLHKLLPDHWRKGKDVYLMARTGAEAVRQFLDDRFRKLRSWQAAREHARPPESKQLQPEITFWRNWTRSRSTPDGYREMAPALEWIAVLHHRLSKDGANPALVAHDLQNVISEALGARNSRDVDELARMCVRFNRTFHAHPVISGADAFEGNDTLFSLEATLDALSGVGETPPPDGGRSAQDRRDFAKLVYMFLNVARVLKPVYRWQPKPLEGDKQPLVAPHEVEGGVRSIAYADFSELRARIFGAQTTIDGLHWILHGGVVPRANRGHTWLVLGTAGSGKSTVGLALAADMARHGRTAIVLCSDERADAVRERLITFGLRDDARYAVLTRAEFESQLELEARQLRSQEPKGVLVVYGAPAEAKQDVPASEARERAALDLERWFSKLSARAAALRQRLTDEEAKTKNANVAARLRAHRNQWRWISVVLDSIETLVVDSPEHPSQHAPAFPSRALLTKLVQTIESSRLWAIVLCGADNPNRFALTYAADTVVELGTDSSELQRQLRIAKCRTQTYDPGQHVVRLIEGSGVVVHPNLESSQRAARRRARRHLDNAHVIRIPERVYWPGAPEDPDHVYTLQQSTLPYVRRGSALLLYGPPQSGKTPFLFNLVSQRMQLHDYPHWRLGANGATLLVTFRSSPYECLRPLAESASLAARWQHNVSDVRLRWYGADATLRAAQIAHELVRHIQRSRRDGVPLDWIVFLGVEALTTYLPEVDAERGFWPTILAITASEEISTAFVVAGEDHAFVAQHRQDMDYVLRFARDEHGNQRTIEILKSAEPPPSCGYLGLQLDLPHGALRELPRAELARTEPARPGHA